MTVAPVETGTGFWSRLADFGDRPALVTAAGTVSYVDLAGRVAHLADRLGRTRRLVLLAADNDVDTVVGYLAALSGGHPVILVPGDNPGNVAALVDAYDPDVLLGDGGLTERRPGTAHDLHPSLALLLSTSGSTGSPKLVRLSHENLASNAAAIADYLGIRPADVAATTLPLHYCYGLSVLNSHLATGAGVLLTSLSVVDACFWDLFRSAGATTFPGVPYTFQLLDRVGFEAMDLPSLRYVTQAGGRLAPDVVRRFAALGVERGWDLFVMYGQTEATARMAYLPPDLAGTAPTTIGVPIPGGSFRIEPLPEAPMSKEPMDVGELVYTGPNVMLGYATTPADLANGAELSELRTGDVARRTRDGLFEVIGRRSRFAKVFGLRIDLDQLERVFAAEGHLVHCADAGERIVVAFDASAKAPAEDTLLAVVHEHAGLPASAVQLLPLPAVPRLPSGKPDYRTLASLAASAGTTCGADPDDQRLDAAAVPGRREERVRELREAYAEVLRRRDVTDEDTFVSLHGDSLSYVEMATRLERVLGHLPHDWHLTPIGALAGRPPRRTRGSTLETNVLLRALAIVMIVGTHANLFVLLGGAHVLLGVAGFNFGRFQLSDAPRSDRVRHLLGSVTRVVVPSVLWLGAVAVLTGDYGWRGVLLLNGVLGPRDWAEPQWWYWFIEALVYTLLAVTALLALPWTDRLERRWPFWLPIGLAGLGLLTRYEVVTVMGGDVIHRANVVFWLFALGWATVKASRGWHRLLVSALLVATVPGFFDDPVRDGTVLVGLLALVWLRAVRVPSWLARAAGVLAAASLYIYLCHWQVYPHLEESYPTLATVLSLLGGIAFWQATVRGPSYVRGLVRRTSAAAARRSGVPAPVVGRMASVE
jgi:acyl-CoA synthetase (AMP-forming)/AMP-acid ligase II